MTLINLFGNISAGWNILYLCRAYSNDIYTVFYVCTVNCVTGVYYSVLVLRTHQYLFPVSDSKVPKYTVHTLCTCDQSQLTKIDFFFSASIVHCTVYNIHPHRKYLKKLFLLVWDF